jgi:PAS domain S-box-containing protein
MFLGLVGTLLGVNFLGNLTGGNTNENNLALIAIIPFTVFVDGILLFLILQIIKPLDELTKKSKKIANGDLNERIKITSHDELGQLGGAFNEMTAKLLEMKQGLENTVKLKTAELETNLEQLKVQQAKDEAIFKSIGEGLILTDDKGITVFINKNAEEILDLNRKGSYGKMLKDLLVLYEEDAKFVSEENKPFIVALNKGETKSSKFILVRKNDQKTIIEMTSSPVIQHETEGNKPTIIGSITTIRDITKEREVDRMKTEFISLASHQLRTPLSSIKWYTEMLLNGDAGPLSADQTELAKSVSASSQIMSEIVGALLNISRMELGKITLNPKPTDLKELISFCVKEVEVKYREKKQVVSIEIPENLPQVPVDPELIKQVYLNLLTNAIKYTPEGGKIVISVAITDDKVLSTVGDSGYGIPKLQQDKIFKKFFRADNVVKKETDGTGLGLYLVKSIVESSKGKIWFESEEGKGTKFFFSLPLNINEADSKDKDIEKNLNQS